MESRLIVVTDAGGYQREEYCHYCHTIGYDSSDSTLPADDKPYIVAAGFCREDIYVQANIKHQTADVIIIGGGVIGCALAYFLRKRQIEVTVLERGLLGGQASGAAAGLLAPLGPLSGPGPLADLVLAAFARFPSLVAELEAASGLLLDYERTGALRAIRNPKRVAHLRKRWENWQPLGLQMFWLNGDEARAHEPLLASDICAAVQVPAESQIDARSMTQAFAQAAQRLGATLLTQQEVTGLSVEGTRVRGVLTAQGETLACGSVVLACGAWTGLCGSWLRSILPVAPLHGQLLVLPQLAQPLRSIILGDGIYLLPRGSRIIVGATREERGFDAGISDTGTAWLHASAGRLIPALTASPILETWSGLRPQTPDTRPILGRLPGWENVLVAAGHNSIGLLLSGITGESMAELLLTGQASPLIQPFSPERFLIGTARA